LTFVRFYRYQDKLVIPTVVQAEEGFYMDTDPVTISDIADEAEIRARVYDALKTQNEVVPTPAPTDEPGSAVLEKLDLKKWRKFEAEAVMFNIYLNESAIEYYSTGRAVSGEWKMTAGKHISLPADTEHSRIVDIIIQELREEKESESGKGGGLMLLPPPPAE
jgi:hypothetical protein